MIGKLKKRDAISIDSSMRDKLFFLFEQIKFSDLIDFIQISPHGGDEIKKIEEFCLEKLNNGPKFK